MWKKIGIKNDTFETPKSNEGSSRSLRRFRPLDEKSIAEKDSSFSRVSVSSSKMSNSKPKQGDLEMPMITVTAPQSSMFYSQSQARVPLTPKSKRQTAHNTGELNHKFSVGQFPRSTVQTRIISKEKAHSDLQDGSPENQQLKESSESFLEDFYMPPVQNQKLVQDYIDRLQKQLRTARKVNLQYDLKLKQYRNYVDNFKRDVNRELESYRMLLRLTAEQTNRRAVAITQANKSIGQTELSEDIMEEKGSGLKSQPPKGVQSPPIYINQQHNIRNRGGLPSNEPEYCVEIQNVMNKIDELKHNVNETVAFKNSILNKIDANLRRVGSAKKTKF